MSGAEIRVGCLQVDLEPLFLGDGLHDVPDGLQDVADGKGSGVEVDQAVSARASSMTSLAIELRPNAAL